MPMLITLNLDASRLWRWHLTLIAQLTAQPDTQVAVTFDRTQRPLDTTVALALLLEATLAGSASPHPF